MALRCAQHLSRWIHIQTVVAVMYPDGEQKEPWLLSKRARGPILRRLVVVVLLIYLVALVPFARGIGGDLAGGFYWTYPGFVLFPIPGDSGSMIPVTEPLTPIDQFVYVVFIWNGMWVAWTAVAVLYIVYPFLLKLRSERKKN